MMSKTAAVSAVWAKPISTPWTSLQPDQQCIGVHPQIDHPRHGVEEHTDQQNGLASQRVDPLAREDAGEHRSDHERAGGEAGGGLTGCELLGGVDGHAGDQCEETDGDDQVDAGGEDEMSGKQPLGPDCCCCARRGSILIHTVIVSRAPRKSRIRRV